MCQEVCHENEEVQIPCFPGKKATMQTGADRLSGSNFAEKILEFLADSVLNVSQGHALQQGSPTANGAANCTQTVGLRKVIVPCIQHTLDT